MKRLLIALALPLWAVQAHGQILTTYGPTDPQSIDGGYFSDYSPNGTVMMTGGSMTMSNASTYEHGNLSFTNNGTWNSQSGSNDLFNGNGALTIGGTTAPGFFNVELLNGGTASIANTSGANIGNQLLFGTSTITSTTRASHSNAAIRFADNATYVGGTTDTQHVNGYITKTGNDAFTFPIGSGADARTLAITAPATSATISAAWFTGSPDAVTDPSDGSTHSLTATGVGIGLVSPAGFWDYILDAGDDDGITIAVSIPDMASFASIANLRLVGWNGTQWIDLSGGATASGNIENSTLSGVMPAGQTITALGIASVQSTPLPVMYSYFTAVANGCSADLKWEAKTDAGFQYFAVERSADGKTFAQIGRVEHTAGTSRGNYQFTDGSPLNGTNYYRIKDVGTSDHYTSVNRVMMDCAGVTIRVYPTATSDLVHVDLPKGYELAKIRLLAGNGQEIAPTIVGEGLTRTIMLSSVAAGQYLLTVEHNSKLTTFRILYRP